MHVTLHLTNGCNMACEYCYVHQTKAQTMTPETAMQGVELAVRQTPGNSSVGVVFFGGEPLLHKDLIRHTIRQTQLLSAELQRPFHFKITTNGLLLDQEFIDYSKETNLFIALSMDGIQSAHDKHRIDIEGKGTFQRVEQSAIHLLASHPYAPVLMTVNPDTVQWYAQSVRYLYTLGFHYIICSLNYAAPWTEEDMAVLKEQYQKLADYYYEMTLAEEKFYLSPFEVKISSHINHKTYKHERCELGKRQLSVGPDGSIFPCVQFVGEPEFAIGHVSTGLDEQRRELLYNQNEAEKETCKTCAVRGRCNHYCGCMNKQTTGSIDEVSPVQCANERILLPIVDRLAERLFKKRSGMFIQKHYNDYYPLVSLVEDKKNKSNG